MKRQKRDRLERAHSQGYKAGLAGRSKEQCPYQQIDPKSEWLGGWREAIENRKMFKTYNRHLIYAKKPHFGAFLYLHIHIRMQMYLGKDLL